MRAWGKLDGKGGEHPLTDHMLDVAACFHAAASVGSVRRALSTVGRAGRRPLDESDFIRLVVLAFLHDVGKANAGLQSKRWLATQSAGPPGWP